MASLDCLIGMAEWMNAGASQAQPGPTQSAEFDPNLAFNPNQFNSTNLNSNQTPSLNQFGLGGWPGSSPAFNTSTSGSQYSNAFIFAPQNQTHQSINFTSSSQPPSLGPFPAFVPPTAYSSPNLSAQLATHVAALDAIGLLQVRLQQLKAVLNSAIHPPGSSLAGTPLGPVHRAKLNHEITNTATKQHALVVQVNQFVAQNGGDSAVQPAILAFRLQQQQIQQHQANVQIQAGLALAGQGQVPGQNAGLSFPTFPTRVNQFSQGAAAVAPSAVPLVASSTGAGDTISPPIPSGTPPVGALPPGLQAAMKARQAAKANAPPPPKPQLKQKPTSTSPPAAAESVANDGRTIAGLPRSRPANSSPDDKVAPKSATARLAEAVPGLPTLTELHKQLKRDQFEASLKHVLNKAGVEMVDPVKLEGKDVALWDMWQVVMVEGSGEQTVELNSSWAAMASHLKLPSSPVAAAALATAYHKQLSPYEDKWSAALLRQREQMMRTRGIGPLGPTGPGDGTGAAPGGLQRGLGLLAQAQAGVLGMGQQSRWQQVPLLSFQTNEEGDRFEEIGDDDDHHHDDADRRRKEPHRPSPSTILTPSSQATPVLAPALASPSATTLYNDLTSGDTGLSSDPLLSMAFDDAAQGRYGLPDLSAFGEGPGTGEVDGLFGFGVVGDVDGILESGFDYDQFLAGAGGTVGLEGEFGGELGYQSWQ